MGLKVNELRIGNLVQDEHGDVQYVYRIWKGGAELASDMDGSDDLDYNEDEMFGVPMTKEWLYKFGFELNGVYASMRLSLNELNESNRTFIVVCPDKTGDGWIEIITKRGTTQDPTYTELQGNILLLKYVHQLQNLYFALANKELNINTDEFTTA